MRKSMSQAAEEGGTCVDSVFVDLCGRKKADEERRQVITKQPFLYRKEIYKL
jgi:hypothetical protein